MTRAMFLSAVALLVFGSTRAHAISFSEALIKAQKLAEGGILVKGRVEGNQTLYGFYFYKNGFLVEIEIGKKDGTVKKFKDQKDPKDAKDIAADVLDLLQKIPAKAKLPNGRLLEIAADHVKGDITAVAFAVRNNELVFKAGDIVLDARTGKLIK